jgi:hypothetical protein
MAERYGRLPLAFEPNVGQTDAQVRFVARGSGYTLFLTDTAAVFALRPASARGARAGSRADARDDSPGVDGNAGRRPPDRHRRAAGRQ